MDFNQFAETIKAKYPEYKDADNLTLAKAVVDKHPEYADKVTFDAPKPTESSMGDVAKEAVKAALPSANFNAPITPTSPNPIKGAIQAAGQTLRDPTRIAATLSQPGQVAGESVEKQTGSKVAGTLTAMALDPTNYVGAGVGAKVAKVATEPLLNAAGKEAASFASGFSNVPIRSITKLFKDPMAVFKAPNSKEAGTILQAAKEAAGVTREEEFLIAKAADRNVGGARTVAEDLRPRFEATKGSEKGVEGHAPLSVGELIAFNRAAGKLAGEAKGSEKALWSGVKADAQAALTQRATKIAEALETYALSKTKGEFTSLFPKTKQGRADYLKTIGAGLSFGLTSPLAIGAGTLAAKGVAKVAKSASKYVGGAIGFGLSAQNKAELDKMLENMKRAK